MVNLGYANLGVTMPIRLTARQIADDLTTRIRAGEYPPDTHLHFAHLGDLYGVSTATIKRAVALLRDRGLVVDQPGRGVFVCEPHP